MTPELWPVWCAPQPASFSTTVTVASGWSSASRCAVARPTMPPPMTTYRTAAPLLVRGVDDDLAGVAGGHRPRDVHVGHVGHPPDGVHGGVADHEADRLG